MTENEALDREVAERVMGWQWAVDECKHPGLNHGRCRKPDGGIVLKFTPSTDIAAAWLVVTAPRFSAFSVGVKKFRDGLGYVARFCWCGEGAPTAPGPAWEAGGDSAPVAICKAALKAVGGKP